MCIFFTVIFENSYKIGGSPYSELFVKLISLFIVESDLRLASPYTLLYLTHRLQYLSISDVSHSLQLYLPWVNRPTPLHPIVNKFFPHVEVIQIFRDDIFPTQIYSLFLARNFYPFSGGDQSIFVYTIERETLHFAAYPSVANLSDEANLIHRLQRLLLRVVCLIQFLTRYILN